MNKLLFLATLTIAFLAVFMHQADYQSLYREQLTPTDVDFPDTKGGTFTGKAADHYYKEPIDEPVVLFISSTVPNLKMLYHPDTNTLEAGSPTMTVEDIELFQGTEHTITYSFANPGEQILLVDGEERARSGFTMQSSLLTGFAIHEGAKRNPSFMIE